MKKTKVKIAIKLVNTGREQKIDDRVKFKIGMHQRKYPNNVRENIIEVQVEIEKTFQVFLNNENIENI